MSAKLRNKSKINLSSVLNRGSLLHRPDKKIQDKLSSDKVHYVNQNLLRFSIGLTFIFANLHFDNYQGSIRMAISLITCKDWLSKMRLLHRVDKKFLRELERDPEGYPRLKIYPDKKGNCYTLKKMHRHIPLNNHIEEIN